MPRNPQRHTPGPWYVSKHATPGYAPQFGIYSEKGPASDIAVTMHYDAEANARLIAAAPDLLEALQSVVDGYWDYIEAGVRDDIQCKELAQELLDEARAAIAAATEGE